MPQRQFVNMIYNLGQKVFSVRYPLVRMPPQTLNYWNEPIQARTQFEKNSVGIPAKFAKTASTTTCGQLCICGHFEHILQKRLSLLI